MINMNDKSSWALVLVVLALFLVFVEPYYAVQTLNNFIIILSYFGIVGILGIGCILYGLMKFVCTGNAIYFQLGLILITFVVLFSQLPIL